MPGDGPSNLLRGHLTRDRLVQLCVHQWPLQATVLVPQLLHPLRLDQSSNIVLTTPPTVGRLRHTYTSTQTPGTDSPRLSSTSTLTELVDDLLRRLMLPARNLILGTQIQTTTLDPDSVQEEWLGWCHLHGVLHGEHCGADATEATCLEGCLAREGRTLSEVLQLLQEPDGRAVEAVLRRGSGC